ncbi:unnamed protein product [Lampetra fluviatilis]
MPCPLLAGEGQAIGPTPPRKTPRRASRQTALAFWPLDHRGPRLVSRGGGEEEDEEEEETPTPPGTCVGPERERMNVELTLVSLPSLTSTPHRHRRRWPDLLNIEQRGALWLGSPPPRRLPVAAAAVAEFSGRPSYQGTNAPVVIVFVFFIRPLM